MRDEKFGEKEEKNFTSEGKFLQKITPAGTGVRK
jgi:hypothetical protein